MKKENKNYICKIKDLPKNFFLDGCKIKEGFIVSGWQKGFWVTDNYENYKSRKYTKVNPVFFTSWEEAQEWKVEVPSSRAI